MTLQETSAPGTVVALIVPITSQTSLLLAPVTKVDTQQISSLLVCIQGIEQ